MQAISNPPPDAHIAPCGLFCTNCRKLLAGKCPGCQVAPGFGRCAVRLCCIDKGITTCAACPDFAAPRDFRECKKLNNLVSRFFALLFGSNRPAALALLRDGGLEAYLTAKRQAGKM